MSSTINNIHICQQNPIHDNYVLYTQKINNIPFAPPLGGWLPCPSLYAIILCTIASKLQTKDQGQEHNTHFKYKYCGPPLKQKSFLPISNPLNRSSRASFNAFSVAVRSWCPSTTTPLFGLHRWPSTLFSSENPQHNRTYNIAQKHCFTLIFVTIGRQPNMFPLILITNSLS